MLSGCQTLPNRLSERKVYAYYMLQYFYIGFIGFLSFDPVGRVASVRWVKMLWTKIDLDVRTKYDGHEMAASD